MGAPGKPKGKAEPRQRKSKAKPPADVLHGSGLVEPGDPFTARRDAATKRHHELVDLRDYSQAGQRQVALAHAEVWRCEAALLHRVGMFDAARKASSSANELEQTAAKLLHDSIADRVAELERRLSTTRKAAAKLAELDD